MFYVYQPLRQVEDVFSEFKDLEKGIKKLGIIRNEQLLKDLGLSYNYVWIFMHYYININIMSDISSFTEESYMKY